ncbi:MAG TPA: rRNA maturation RNase YbeY, partial [Pyrinomonadaceae bacterium]
KTDWSATIAFVSDKRIRELNRQFRGIDKATDVLSFPAEEESNLGDVAVSVETAAAQARENGLTFDREIAQLILHGLLHLSGYDHETDNGQMNRLELKLRKKLKID